MEIKKLQKAHQKLHNLFTKLFPGKDYAFMVLDNEKAPELFYVAESKTKDFPLDEFLVMAIEERKKLSENKEPE